MSDSGRERFDIDAENAAVVGIAKQFREQFPDCTVDEVSAALHILDRDASHRHNWSASHKENLRLAYRALDRVLEAR